MNTTIHYETKKGKKRKTYTMIVKIGDKIIHTRVMALRKIKQFIKSYNNNQLPMTLNKQAY